MMVSNRSNDSALARKGMLSSKAASNVRRATPVTDRCQPRSASRDGFVLLLEARPLGAAAATLRLGQPPLDRDAGGGRLLLDVVWGVEQLAQLARLLGREVAQPAQLARQLGAGRVARLGCEQEAEHRPQTQAQQERPEPRAPLAHSPASRSSGAATATGRGCACDCSGGLTKRSVIARVPVTRSCSNRNAKFFSRSAAIAPWTSAGRSHMRRLDGPIAFLRLL